MTVTNFQGWTVLTIESRRGQEMSRLIETWGGKACRGAAMGEIALYSNVEALKFSEALFEGKIDAVIFLTGAGAGVLCNGLEGGHPAEKFYAALRKVCVIARGPKPVAVLREWKVPVTLAAPEPNTWHEVLRVIDESKRDLRGKNVALQEYGVSNAELLEGLRERGAHVKPVPVYQWALPEHTAPLRIVVADISAGRIDVALFTTSVQVIHLFQIAEQARKKEALSAGLKAGVKASIGPTTSESLRGYGLSVDLEASHPKMGFLVKEAAERPEELQQRNR